MKTPAPHERVRHFNADVVWSTTAGFRGTSGACAALIRDGRFSDDLLFHGLSVEDLAPSRPRPTASRCVPSWNRGSPAMPTGVEIMVTAASGSSD